MEESSFFNSVDGDRQYDMEQFALYFKQFLSTGIYHTDNVPALKVSTVAGLTSKIEPGSAYIEGFMYSNTEDITFTHEAANPTNPRIDRIVIRLDRSLNKRSVNAVVKKGTAATTPQPPALQRDDIVYEISVAQVRVNAGSTVINSITDERLNTSVAGLVSSLITVPTDQFVAEWTTWMDGMNQQKATYQQSWETWFATRQNDIGAKVTTGSTEPSGIAAGDIWIKSL